MDWKEMELSDNLTQWGYINKKQPLKSFVFRHVALTLSHLNFNLTIHSTLPYFLHSQSIIHPNMNIPPIIPPISPHIHSLLPFISIFNHTYPHYIYLIFILSNTQLLSIPILNTYHIDLIGFIG